MALKTVLCLFRNDLRVHDNEMLSWACANAKSVLPLYCFDPRHYEKTHNYKFPKTGIHRLKFLLQSVSDLRETLKSHGSNLIIRMGEPERVVEEIHRNVGLSAIVFQREATKEELDVEEAVCKFAEEEGNIKVNKIWGSTLYHIDDLPYDSIDQVQSIYTYFRNKMEKHSHVREEMVMPKKFPPLPSGLDEGVVPSVEDFKMADAAKPKHTAFPFSGGETSGVKRVKDYIWETHNIDDYKETRNDLIGSEYSTKFSPWLALGCVSPRFIHWELKRYSSSNKKNTDGPYWVVFELIWRDFFKYSALKFGNRFFFSYGIKTYTENTKKIEWKYNEEQFKAWAEGETGIPFVDANMKELLATGWMSNRGRQNVASFLTRDLQLDWRLGAEWFESYLLDHDVCSNYGNWMWTAGVGGDPRGAYRKFNMIKQGLDYDPNGDYVRLWLPELKQIQGGLAHVPWTLSLGEQKSHGLNLGKNYPKPIIVAPEWEKHAVAAKKAKTAGKSAKAEASAGKSRGLDFYFKKEEMKDF